MHLAVDGSGLARPWAGVGTYTREMVAALARGRPGARITLFAPTRPGIVEAAEARPLPSTPLVGRHLLWPLQLRRLAADAFFGPAAALPLGGAAAPSVVTAHDMAIYRHPEWFPGGQALSVRVVVPRSMRRAGAVIAVSACTARDVAELFGVEPGRLVIVPEGVAGRFHPVPAAALAGARERWRLPERCLLFVGTVEPRKNLPTLLAAWGRMRRPRPALVVAGGWGWRCREVRAALEGGGEEVRVLGPVETADLPLLYNLATCLCHPAWYEGFGLTPLEAMACGTPVVASSAASLPEVVGDAGLLVDPGDVEGWTEALERACDDQGLRAELRRRGLERAAGFTWERAAEATWRVIDRVTGLGR